MYILVIKRKEGNENIFKKITWSKGRYLDDTCVATLDRNNSDSSRNLKDTEKKK